MEEEILLSIISFADLPELTIHDTWEKLLNEFILPPHDIFYELKKQRQYYFALATDQHLMLSGANPVRPMHGILTAMLRASLIQLRAIEIQLVHLHLLAQNATVAGTDHEIELFANVLFKLNVLCHTELFHVAKRQKQTIPYPEAMPAVKERKAIAIYAMCSLNELVAVLRTTFIKEDPGNRKNPRFDDEFLGLMRLLVYSINKCIKK